jgi:hypothetical protein
MRRKSFVELVAKGVRQAKPQHFAQMQIYMRLTTLTRAMYLAVNKDTTTSTSNASNSMPRTPTVCWPRPVASSSPRGRSTASARIRRGTSAGCAAMPRSAGVRPRRR